MNGRSGSWERTIAEYWKPKWKFRRACWVRSKIAGHMQKEIANMIRRFGYAVRTVLAIASLARAGTVTFSFSGGGITSSGTLTFVPVADTTSGVSTPGTHQITEIRR